VYSLWPAVPRLSSGPLPLLSRARFRARPVPPESARGCDATPSPSLRRAPAAMLRVLPQHGPTGAARAPGSDARPAQNRLTARTENSPVVESRLPAHIAHRHAPKQLRILPQSETARSQNPYPIAPRGLARKFPRFALPALTGAARPPKPL